MKIAKYSNMPVRQRGIALYIALIMLLLLSLLGLAAVQVSTMQERMAGNFNTLNLSFQNAEAQIRSSEFNLKSQVDGTGAFLAPLGGNACSNQEVDIWAGTLAATQAAAACITEVANAPSDSLVQGQDALNLEFPSFRLYASAADRGVTNSSTVTVLETVFIP